MQRSAALALFSTFLLSVAAGAAELGPGVEEVQRCAERNLPEHTARQQIVFERRDRAGNRRRLEATLLWKRDSKEHSRVIAVVEAPADERGTGFLMIEREGASAEMWSYLPELGRVRRVTSRSASSFLGTDLSYEDLEELQHVADRARVERLPDAEWKGRAVYVLAGRPAEPSDSAYERVVSQIDRESCVALHTSLEQAGGRVVKEAEIEFVDLEQRGERWLPRKLLLRNLENGSETRLSIEKLELELDLPDRLFTQGQLTKGR